MEYLIDGKVNLAKLSYMKYKTKTGPNTQYKTNQLQTDPDNVLSNDYGAVPMKVRKRRKI